MGADMSLQYRWYQQGKPVGHRMETTLRHGDFYVMSSKAVGKDWMQRKTLTLRHSAGKVADA
jgi:hypothetical protein